MAYLVLRIELVNTEKFASRRFVIEKLEKTRIIFCKILKSLLAKTCKVFTEEKSKVKKLRKQGARKMTTET